MSERPGSSSSGGADPHMTVRTAGPPRLGGVLGRYELLQVLGHGAMATVFRARDTHLGREVAVKVMTLAVAARSDSAERFRREAQAVAAVKHPGIVEIFDFVAASDGDPAYIVSELINGPTLRQFLDGRRGRLLPESAALLALPLAEALHAAHARGVIHRDIKPDNVMLECGASERKVVLTDFGVAHVTGLETMTATGALVGSPSYMSPEQARGHDVGPSSDLFSFGVLLYEMATGHLPFTGKDPLMILGAISRGIYKRPSQVSPFVGPAFDEICVRCLRAVAGERPGSAGDVAEQLRGFCRSAGLDVGGGDLRRLLDDAEAFEAELRPRMASAAVVLARKHARRAELARALAELSRATAYVPGHAEATRLITTISSRRRWALVAAVAAGVLAIAAGVVKVGPQLRARWGTAGAQEVAAKIQPPAAPVVVEPTAGETQPAPGSAVAGVPAAAVGAKAGGSKSKRRGPVAGVLPPVTVAREKGSALAAPGPVGTTSTTAASASPDAGAAAVATISAETLPKPAEPPAPVPRVEVEIYAANVFCDPSLDDGPARVSPATYEAVKAGVHRIYCTMPGGDRLLVGNHRIGPARGGGPFKILVRKVGDKPAIDLKLTSQVAEAPAAASPANVTAPTQPGD
jgi:hypothetical protein